MRWAGLWRCRRELINRRGWDHVVRESSRFITICLIRTNKCPSSCRGAQLRGSCLPSGFICVFFCPLCFFAATQTRQPGEPDRGVPPQTEAPPGVWVLRPHGAHRAGPPPQGVSCALLSSERLSAQWRCLLVLTINTTLFVVIEKRPSSRGSESLHSGSLIDWDIFFYSNQGSSKFIAAKSQQNQRNNT